jgi:hypothetical protein
MNTTPDRRQYSHANDRSPTGSNEPWAIPVSDFISQAERNYGREALQNAAVVKGKTEMRAAFKSLR